MALITQEHLTIGTVELFGTTLWFGWLMIGALLYSVILPVIFGRLKIAPARELHDKVLWADAAMNKADWMTGAAAILGILGIGFGLWWADAVAAMIIAADVLHDGFHHTTAAIRDLMEEMPRSVDDEEFDPVDNRVSAHVNALPWARDSKACLREDGRFLTGTIYVQPHNDHVDPKWVSAAEASLRQLHWRVDNVSITSVENLRHIQGGRTG